MWQDLATAFCLMLVLEGIIPFLYPRRWREMVAVIALIDDRSMRLIGLSSMIVGTLLLYMVR